MDGWKDEWMDRWMDELRNKDKWGCLGVWIYGD